jgi:hypothetical protein
MPRLLGHRTQRETERRRRGKIASQAAIAARKPMKQLSRIVGSFARRMFDIGFEASLTMAVTPVHSIY